MSGVTFSDSDSAPAPHFKTPAPVPTPKNFQTSTPTPVNTLPSRLTHIKVILSILPHEAKFMSWLFCLR